MISLCEECEFSVVVADLIESMSSITNFKILIWVNGSEIPFTYHSSECDFHFLQEGVRVTHGKKVDYLFYDTMVTVRVEDES